VHQQQAGAGEEDHAVLGQHKVLLVSLCGGEEQAQAWLGGEQDVTKGCRSKIEVTVAARQGSLHRVARTARLRHRQGTAAHL
jgi:hypothetical protein